MHIDFVVWDTTRADYNRTAHSLFVTTRKFKPRDRKMESNLAHLPLLVYVYVISNQSPWRAKIGYGGLNGV